MKLYFKSLIILKLLDTSLYCDGTIEQLILHMAPHKSQVILKHSQEMLRHFAYECNLL